MARSARPRLERGLHRLGGLVYRGGRYVCPCCGGRFRKFLPAGVERRANARCPGCGSRERHRLLWLYLSERTNLFAPVSGGADRRLLHVAPEPVFAASFSRLPHLEYVSADLDSPLARERVDICDLPYEDVSFDAILCVHVLEHVSDDRKAMREFFRVLRPGGFAILQVPMQRKRVLTYEDASVVDPQERLREFGQEDHLRVYGRDYAERLEEAGFQVKRDRFVKELPPDRVERHRLKQEDIYYCTRLATRQ
jgi:SAM-dependent methyltransferase